MRVASVNVNGIRAAMRKGMDAWLAARNVDILLLQETRAEEEIVGGLLPGWEVEVAASRLKGRAGVAVAVPLGGRIKLGAVRHGLPGESSDVDSGRWIEADLEADGTPLTAVSAYFHSGTAGTPSMDAKYAHLELVSARLAELDAGRLTVIAGDFNVVRGPNDIKNFKPNHNKTAGVFDEEMAYLEGWFAADWVDVHRALVPGGPGPYTWWSQRGKAFDNDAGWRIDYQMANPLLAAKAAGAVVDRAPSYQERWSDHAPLVIDYDVL